MLTLRINDLEHLVDAPPAMPLLWVLRDRLNLTGAKFGCGMGLCGACTVHLDGSAIRSCTFPAAQAVGREITTIEGVRGIVADAVRSAWAEADVVQCGYCQPGQIMTAIDLLTTLTDPSDDEIRAAMNGVVCRCGTYLRVAEAVRRAAARL